MGVGDLFEGIYGADHMGEVCKPDEEAFEKVLSVLPSERQQIVFFEDSFKNLMAAKKFGWKTVLIGT